MLNNSGRIGFCLLAVIAMCWSLPFAAGAQSSLAVIVSKSPSLTGSEQVSLANLVGKAFADSGQYKIVDPDTINRMLEDEVAEALLLGNESKLDEIQQKYQVDVLVNTSAQVESSSSVANYVMASSSVTISCRSKNSTELFAQKTSAPQNGYHGMPEWLGSTAEAARRVAILASLADIFQQLDIAGVEMPLPVKPAIKLRLEKNPPAGLEFIEDYRMAEAEAEELVKLAAGTIGSKSVQTARVLDRGKRIAAIGILTKEIDLQRNRRLDTAEFQILDFRKKRLVTSFQLPREIDGIRRPRSREIADFAFAPSGRFVVVASRHPAVWVYDVLGGAMLAGQALNSVPDGVSLSEDGQYIRIDCGGKEISYRIVSEGNI